MKSENVEIVLRNLIRWLQMKEAKHVSNT